MPSRKLAASVSGLLLVADFFIQGFSNLITDLEPIARFMPSHYFQGGYAMDGLDLGPVLALSGLALALALLALWRYRVRDLRVGGEGGWGMSWLKRCQPATDSIS